MVERKKVVWFVGCEESDLPKCLAHVEDYGFKNPRLPRQVVERIVDAFSVSIEENEEATVTVTRGFMTQAEIEALPDA